MVTPRAPNGYRWSHSKRVALIWVTSACIFYALFQMAVRNSSHDQTPTSSSSSGSAITNGELRSKLYDKMERDLDENGAAFLKQGETSQSLSLSDIFTLKDGSVTPVLKAANPPVRANVLYLSTAYSVHISEAVKHIFNPYFDKAIWFQNSSLYHFSMFHASHHIAPVPANEDEIEAEASAVHAVADVLCPLKIVLDRVVLTSTGVLLGCWQVISGTDPIAIRAKLRTALPHAPQKQLTSARHGWGLRRPWPPEVRIDLSNKFHISLAWKKFESLFGSPLYAPHGLDFYPFIFLISGEKEEAPRKVTGTSNPENLTCYRRHLSEKHIFLYGLPDGKPFQYDPPILHTSFARLLGHPTASSMEMHKTSDEVQFFHDLVARLNNKIRGFEAVVSELWYVEEYDVLALALDGRMKVRRFQLGCS